MKIPRAEQPFLDALVAALQGDTSAGRRCLELYREARRARHLEVYSEGFEEGYNAGSIDRLRRPLGESSAWALRILEDEPLF